nr:leucine zipper domain-containing protein [Streptomyces sp. col6]
MARCVVENGWPVRRAAERFQVSHTTTACWARGYRQLGVTGISDRSSRDRGSNGPCRSLAPAVPICAIRHGSWPSRRQ